MKTLTLIVLLAYVHVGTPAALIPCPKSCKCVFKEDILDARCTSQKFLLKIDDRQANSFEKLDLSNSSVTLLDKRMKKLKNLKYLDVSDNQIRDLQYFPNLPKLEVLSLSKNQLETVPVSLLPKGIKQLDLSSNYISDLPKDMSTLHNLQFLNLQENPIRCDENAINGYVNLVSLKVNITEHVKCHSPKDMNGKSLHSLIADALLNPMLGDQEEASEEEDPDNSEFIRHSTDKPEKAEKPPTEDDLFEGSGDEGSGDFDKEDPSACVIDCSTFKPLEVLKENNSSPLLSIKEQVSILFEDLFGKEQDPTTVAPPPPSSTAKTPVEEVVTKKTVSPDESAKTTKKTEKLVVSAKESKSSGEVERASFDEGLTYYLIGTVIILMIIVAIFIIVKRRVSQGKARRRRNSLTENGICEEMKPLGKYREISNGTNNEKQKEEEAGPERIPLMNGQNGKSENTKGSLEDLDVTMRSPENEEASSPKPERVTIKSGEIAPSVLKTPQLVHREINSDGQIVTKPLDDSY